MDAVEQRKKELATILFRRTICYKNDCTSQGHYHKAFVPVHRDEVGGREREKNIFLVASD